MQKPTRTMGNAPFVLGLLLFPVLELLPYAFSLTINVGGRQFPSQTLSAFVFRKVAEIFEPPLLSISGVEVISRLIILHPVLICVILFAVMTSNFMTGKPIAVGQVNVGLVLWIAGALLLAVFGPSIADIIFSGTLGPRDFFGQDCKSIPLLPSETTSSLLFIWPLLGTVFLVPLNEEILYRGFLAQLLEPRFGVWGTGLATSVLFAFLHWQSGAQTLVLFFAGVLLYCARLRFGGITAPFLMHCMANATKTFYALLKC